MNHKLTKAIHNNLTKDLLKPMYRKGRHWQSGHCYVASEVYKYLSKDRLQPMYMKHEGVSHWFLRDLDSGELIDLTKHQFRTPPDYDIAIAKGFLTVQPSKRAQVLIERILNGETKRAKKGC